MKTFSEIILLPSLPDGNPAIVNVKTRVLRLSQEYWNVLPHVWKVFILYHELGHINAGKSEEAAEKWAIDKFIAHGYSPKQLIKAHTEVYPWKSISQDKIQGLLQKTRRAVEIAKHMDFHHNGNTKISLLK